jgi:hypothetical protein
VHRHGASNRTGTLEFVAGAGSAEFGIENAVGRQVTREKIQVPCRRLDELEALADAKSLVLKIDVEGHEREVVEGAQALIDAGRVRAILIDGYADKSLPARLQDLGFELYEGLTLEPIAGRPPPPHLGHHTLLALRPDAASKR